MMRHRSASLLLPVVLLACLLAPLRARASGPERRLRGPIDDRARVMLPGTRPPRAAAAADLGRLSRAARLQGVTLILAPSAGQEAELRALIAAQHDPSSPQYHRWLTPEAFGARFGVADGDLAQVQAWLRGHGLQIQGIARARNRIAVAGTVDELEAAFATELHALRVDGEAHFAPAGEVTVPAAIAPLVRAVAGLSSFRPRPRVRPAPRYASAQSGAHFLSPGDVDVVYGVHPLRTSGLDGAGVGIDVVGQSTIAVADVEAFQRAAGLPVKDPVLVQVPNSGVATAVSGDEGESDLDLEWSSAMAPGATVRFVFVGDAANANVWDALVEAVDENAAQIISMSYGMCEPGLSASTQAALDQALAQAAAQGQSVVVASGDAGSVDCFDVSGLSSTIQRSVAVDFPASSAYVTAVGGTEVTADAATSATYWAPAGGTDLLVSALSYVPQQAWNDGAVRGGPAAGGGGVSLRTPRPSWQAGVAGMPAGAERLVPDLSLAASPVRVPYLYCSRDSGVDGSCANGFRDANGEYLTTAGGTSFGAPVFAGMLALLEQGLGGGRQGVVATTLYQIAADPARYAAAFHDVTEGGNQCAGSSACAGLAASSYAAGPGYDLATGLGAIDLGALLAAWPPPSPGFTAAGTDVAVASGGTVTSAMTVVPVGGWSGSVTWTVTSTPALGAGCLSIPDTDVAAGKVAHAGVTIRASSEACVATSAGVLRPPGDGSRGGGGGAALAALAALAAVGLVATARRPRRRWAALASLVGAAALGLPACGGGGSGGGEGRAAVTYAVQVVGTDKASPAITGTASFTLTVN